MKIKHFEKTVIGKVRKANEDYIGSLTNDQTNGKGDLFIVCDGMGGHVGGAIASKKAVECIKEHFQKELSSIPTITLNDAIKYANEQIYALSRSDSSLRGMGTTCTVLLKKKDNIYIAHVGDSRIYINTDEKLYRLTKDHSFVQSLVDAGQLEDSDMESHPRKNELTKALGISPEVEVEVAENPILSKAGDKFLLCSDGLCGLVNDPTISNTINTTFGDDTVTDLISLAENAGGNDNISVCVIHIAESPHQETIFKDQTNKSNDLSATQVLDASSMRGDTKFNIFFKTYKYILLFLSVLLTLGLGFLIYNSFNTSDKVITPVESQTSNSNDDQDNTGNGNQDSESQTSTLNLEKVEVKKEIKNKVDKDKAVRKIEKKIKNDQDQRDFIKKKESDSLIQIKQDSINKQKNEEILIKKKKEISDITKKINNLIITIRDIGAKVNNEIYDKNIKSYVENYEKALATNDFETIKMRVADLEKYKPDFFNKQKQFLRDKGYINKKFEWMIGSNCNIPTIKVNDEIFYKYVPRYFSAESIYIEQEKIKKSYLDKNYKRISKEEFDTLNKKDKKASLRVYDSKLIEDYSLELKYIKNCSGNKKGNEEIYINPISSNK